MIFLCWQKTAYEMRISDWSSDVCSSDLLLSHVMAYEAAVALAYLAGMATAYLLSRAFVFARSGRTVADEALRFALVNLVALAQVWVVSVGLARLAFPAMDFAWHAEDIAHLIGLPIPAVPARQSAG